MKAKHASREFFFTLLLSLILSLNLFSIPIYSQSKDKDIGWELLDSGQCLHIWNQYDSYYFNTSSALQFSNHYHEYWSKNVFAIGYYNGGKWSVIYWSDSLSNFQRTIDSDETTFVNCTLWKDLSYGAYDFRLAIRYHLKIGDSRLSVQLYIENLGMEIPFDLGFAWQIKDIKISNTQEDDVFIVGWPLASNSTLGDGDKYYLNQTLDKSYTNVTCLTIRDEEKSETLDMSWPPSLIGRMKLTVKSVVDQYNAPVTICVNAGSLAIGQKKDIIILWHDASVVDSYTDRSTAIMARGLHPSPSTPISGVSQSFNATIALKVIQASMLLRKEGSPTGYGHIAIYALTGTYGTDSKPTGEPLAKSEVKDVSQISSAAYEWVTLNFNVSNQLKLTLNTKYCVAWINPSSGTIDLDDYILVGVEHVAPMHEGNYAKYQNSAWDDGTYDVDFYIYGVYTIANINGVTAPNKVDGILLSGIDSINGVNPP